MYFVYIIYSEKLDRYYVGMTENLRERLKKHNAKNKGFTRMATDWKVCYTETFPDKIRAMKREKEIKARNISKVLWTIVKSLRKSTIYSG